MNELKEVIIELTKQCNLSCIHCGSGCERVLRKDELSIKRWKGLISELSEMKVKKIVFSGGEPTLKPGLGELLVFAHSLGIKVGFISNGFLAFSRPLQEAISQSCPFAIGLSIDGLKKTHNIVRGNKDSWKRLMKNISILQEIGVQICAVSTLHALNHRELPRLASFLEFAEIDSWQLQLAMPSGRMKQRSELLLGEKDFKALCLTVTALRKSHPKLNIQAADCFGMAPSDSIRSGYWSGCTAGIHSMAIDACGNVMACLSMQDGGQHENCQERSISEIWKNSIAFDFNRNFQAEQITGKCKGCDFLSKCRGGCNSQSLAYYGCFHSSPFCFVRSFTHQ